MKFLILHQQIRNDYIDNYYKRIRSELRSPLCNKLLNYFSLLILFRIELKLLNHEYP